VFLTLGRNHGTIALHYYEIIALLIPLDNKNWVKIRKINPEVQGSAKHYLV